MRPLPLLLFTLILLSTVASASAEPRKRFEAKFADGSRLEGNQLRDWHANDSPPQLEKKKLLDPANPMRWLIDHDLQPATSAYPAVELQTGDRLPGVVVRYQSDSGKAYPIGRDRLLVRASVELRPPSSPPSAYVDVAVEYVKRVVWSQQARSRIEPGFAFLRDGRRVRFRAVRFADSSVRLRTEEGVKTLGFNELAELHLPTPPAWETHWNALADLCPDGRARLIQLETNDGLIATTSMDRFRAFRRGSPTEFEKWVHGVQPAWSSQILWTPSKNIWMRRSFAPHEVPLSRITPSKSVSRSSLNGSPHPWRTDRNREQRPLRSGGKSYGWGFGGHAFLELSFPLDPRVKKLDCEFGLDSLSGEGGSVQGRVAIAASDDATPIELGKSSALVGRTAPHRFQLPCKLDPDGGLLVLTADPLDKAEPEGADPLDIRDAVDWLDPLLILDEQQTRLELARRSLQRPAAWSQWTVTSAEPQWNEKANDGAQLFKLPFVFDPAWRNYWDPSIEAPGGFSRGLVAKNDTFRISREYRLRPGQRRWLIATLYRPFHENEDVWIEARMDGVSLGRRKAPLREGGRRDYEPMVFPLPLLEAGPDRTVQLELIQEPTKGSTPIVWAGAEVRDRRPRVTMLVDEEIKQPWKSSEDVAAQTSPIAFAGKKSMHLKSGKTYYMELDPPITLATSNDYSSPRYVQLAYRKRDKGRFAIVLHHAGDVERPLRYHFGPSPYVFEPSVGVQSGELRDQWMTAMRDVVGDFGKVEVNGLSIVIPDGGDLLVDRLCFGRHPSPLSQLMQRRAPDKPLDERWDAFQKQFTNHVRAALVHLQTPGGAFTGALISNSGEILTSTRCLQQLQGAEATATLSDGRTASAKVVGFAKAFNCGMLKIEKGGPWPYIAVATQPEYLIGDLAVAGRAASPSDRTFDLAEIDFQTDQRVWLKTKEGRDLQQEGSAMLDRHGALLGFSAGPSPFGETVVRCRDLHLPQMMDKLRKNELKAGWCVGAEPQLGADFRLHADGLEIDAIRADSPAAKAGLKRGDIVTRLDNRVVRSISDIVMTAGEHDGGQRVGLRYVRDGKATDIAITFGPSRNAGG